VNNHDKLKGEEMDIFEAVKTRKSVRSFEDRDVPEDVLMKLLEAARIAPSASNRQEWRFVVVRDAATRAKLAEAANGQKFVGEAPVVLVGCAETDDHMMSCGQYCYPIDVAIAIDHLSLCAAAEGLGTCWIGAFNEEDVKLVLGIPSEIRVVELMPLGYPKDPSVVEKKRLSIDEIVKYDLWE
jgi:nitroreductase